jgi:hypothetical protein
MAKYIIFYSIFNVLICNNLKSVSRDEVKNRKYQIFNVSLNFIKSSVNYYSLMHFLEYGVLALLKFIKISYFWIISISWEILELFFPYNWAKENWSNKIFDLGFNYLGFSLTRRFIKNNF